MMRLRLLVAAGILALGSGLGSAAAPRWLLPTGMAEPSVPDDNPLTKAKIELGRRLFYHADLSADGTMSCATCHEQHRAFTEGNATHPGVTGERGRRNAQSLGNVAWLTPLTFADPTLTTLEMQVGVPLFGTHPIEMGMAGREQEIAVRLGRDGCYQMMFAAAFPEAHGRIEFRDVAKAIASFERTMISFGSDFDRGRLTAEAEAGRGLFARECAGCHAGPLFTDRRFHKIDPGVPGDDGGLGEKTGGRSDEGKFRTPPLRNVSLTAPYWHDGSAPTIAGAIERHGLHMAATDTAQLIAFLEALTDLEFTKREALSLPMTACGRPL